MELRSQAEKGRGVTQTDRRNDRRTDGQLGPQKEVERYNIQKSGPNQEKCRKTSREVESQVRKSQITKGEGREPRKAFPTHKCHPSCVPKKAKIQNEAIATPAFR